MTAPVLVEHAGVRVIRDDLLPGGTKARFLAEAIAAVPGEVVYASPAEGGAQTAIATVGAQLGRPVTIFVAHRAELHPRVLMAQALGAKIMQVRPGYLVVVQKRAADYCAATGARLLPFGLPLPGAEAAIADAAQALHLWPREVWCAAGSGVLARGLARGWPTAPWPFGHALRDTVPFPSDPHYDAKAWILLLRAYGPAEREGLVFWNVTGPASAVRA